MRKLFIGIIVYLSFGVYGVAAQEKPADDAIDIRFRSIVYFYPDTKSPTQAQLDKYLTDYARVDDMSEVATKPVVSMSILDDFQESYPAPPLDYLTYSGRGLSKAQGEAIQNAKQILLVDAAYPRTMFLTGYKPVVEFLYEISTAHKGLIWDSETRELYEPGTWKERRLDGWNDEFPNITKHITIHAYDNGGDGIRAITLGMIKFSLPDIVVNDFSWSSNNPVGNLINLTAQSIFEGTTPGENGKLKLDISKLKNAEMRQSLSKDLKENAVPELEVDFGEGKQEEGDPNNFLLEILFDSGAGDSLSEKQDDILSKLFGWEDSISLVKHDALILEASKKAKAKLTDLRRDFRRGLEPGEFILLKAPFKTTEGTNEWMWVEVTAWKGTKVTGLLKNEPVYVPDLKGGSIVEINQNDVFDYIRDYPDGRSEGNETGKIMMERNQ